MKKFQGLGRSLGKNEQKLVMGGVADGNVGTCCAHSADWSYYSQCGLSQSEAQGAASNFAQQTGGHGYWCCTGCGAHADQ